MLVVRFQWYHYNNIHRIYGHRLRGSRAVWTSCLILAFQNIESVECCLERTRMPETGPPEPKRPPHRRPVGLKVRRSGHERRPLQSHAADPFASASLPSTTFPSFTTSSTHPIDILLGARAGQVNAHSLIRIYHAQMLEGGRGEEEKEETQKRHTLFLTDPRN